MKIIYINLIVFLSMIFSCSENKSQLPIFTNPVDSVFTGKLKIFFKLKEGLFQDTLLVRKSNNDLLLFQTWDKGVLLNNYLVDSLGQMRELEYVKDKLGNGRINAFFVFKNDSTKSNWFYESQLVEFYNNNKKFNILDSIPANRESVLEIKNVPIEIYSLVAIGAKLDNAGKKFNIYPMAKIGDTIWLQLWYRTLDRLKSDKIKMVVY